MLQRVELEDRHLEDYRSIVGDEVLAEIEELAAPLREAHIVNVNATSYGGGVAEILHALVPLMRDVGIDVEWQTISGAKAFFDVTKTFHNGLQGMDVALTKKMKEIWQRYNEENARAFEGTYDVAVVHDPQPAGLVAFDPPAQVGHWVWRSHIDTSDPTPAFWDFLVPYIQAYAVAIFTLEAYAGPGMDPERLVFITPTIDPLKPKNQPLSRDKARDIVAEFGPDMNRPLITQVSRYDPWKDPIGVIDAYRIVKQDIPEVQLALVGAMATDDPEGWAYLERTIRHAGDDYDIYIPHNYRGVDGFIVGAFQTASDVIVQKSKREGFGLTVTEGLWHGRPVVGGAVGGIRLQIVDGENGFLVSSVKACAEKIHYLLTHPDEADAMGRAGRERVRERYLITRHLADYLRLFNRLASAKEPMVDSARVADSGRVAGSPPTGELEQPPAATGQVESRPQGAPAT